MPKSSHSVKEMSHAVGEFIRYWGFRRIHGQIWTQIYLSKQPLSGVELTKRLGVSKALVSPALAELEDFDLIRLSGGDGKTKAFTANPDVFGVIRKILRQREKVLIDKALKAHGDLKLTNDELDKDRVEALKQMILSAQSALSLILELSDESHLGTWDILQGEVR